MTLGKTGFESSLYLKKLYFEKFSFERPEGIPEDMKLKMRLDHDIVALNESEYKIILNVEILDESAIFNLSITTVGVFEISLDKDPNEFDIDKIVTRNTVTIMLPYIRSQVSLITTQPDLTPLVLPPFNIIKYMEQQIKK